MIRGWQWLWSKRIELVGLNQLSLENCIDGEIGELGLDWLGRWIVDHGLDLVCLIWNILTLNKLRH